MADQPTINGKEFEDLNIICKLSICKETHNQQNEGKLEASHNMTKSFPILIQYSFQYPVQVMKSG